MRVLSISAAVTATLLLLAPATITATLPNHFDPQTSTNGVSAIPRPNEAEEPSLIAWRGLQALSDECKTTLTNDTEGECSNEICSSCEFNLCYARPNAVLGDEYNCDVNDPRVDVCPDLQNPTPQDSCPDGISLEWANNGFPTERISHGVNFTLTSTIKVDASRYTVVNAPCGLGVEPSDASTGLIPHVNAHTCNKRATDWWCTTLVPSYQISDVTVSPGQCSSVSNHSFNALIDVTNPVSPNVWSIFVHYVFYTQDVGGDGTLTKRQITMGSSFLVKGEELVVRRFVANSMLGISVVLVLFPGLSFLFLIWRFRQHAIIKAAHVEMSMLIIFGGVLGFICMTLFVPLELSDAQCQARQWLLPIAFDFIVIPLFLKTFVVYKIFVNPHLQPVMITKTKLRTYFGVVLAIEVIFNLIWSLVTSIQMKAREINPTSLNVNAFEVQCAAEDRDSELWLFTFSVIVHSVPLAVLTYMAQRIRLSFRFSETLRKHDKYDESLYIMLACLNLFIAGFFVLIFQTIIEANPNSVTVMRVLGLGWVVFFTLITIYLPKFMKIFRDGLKARAATADAKALEFEAKSSDAAARASMAGSFRGQPGSDRGFDDGDSGIEMNSSVAHT